MNRLTAALLFFVFHLAGSFLNNYPWFDRTPVSITMNEYVAQEFHDPEQNYDIPGSRNMNACELLMSPDLVIGRDLPIPGIDFGSYRIPTEVLLYLAAAFIIGLFSTLANGCPMRQHVMAGSGNLSSMLFLLGFYGAVLFYDKFLADFFNSLIAW